MQRSCASQHQTLTAAKLVTESRLFLRRYWSDYYPEINGISDATQIHEKGNFYTNFAADEKEWMTIEIRQFSYIDVDYGRDKSHKLSA